MIGYANYSQWGIKDSGEDITNDIVSMVQNANDFIVIGGYNFSFSNAGQTFFDEITLKANNGIPVLMIFPPRLFGPYNPQPNLINYCLSNNIAVILSHNNHSKWLLTDESLYYGSSNFSPTSWRQKIEVVTIHKHDRIERAWSNDTVMDFVRFIQREINSLSRRSTMNNYPGLRQLTTTTWNQIQTMVLRFNPSIDKVIATLNNYENVNLELNEITQEWFYASEFSDFKKIFECNNKIMVSINSLCAFAYSNIYNESIQETSIDDQSIIDDYNDLHNSFKNSINKSELILSEISNKESPRNDLREINRSITEKIYSELNYNFF